MSDVRKVYKVVLRQGEALWSASTRSADLITKYLPDVEVRGDYPLFAFDTLYHALGYAHPLSYPFEIWDADPVGEISTRPFVAAYHEDIHAYWRSKVVPVVPSIPGAILCDALIVRTHVNLMRPHTE